MMWRGTLYSALLHGSIVVALFAGLPVLPDIFKRTPESETGSSELPISVDVVSADAVDLRQDVIAPETPAANETTPSRAAGKLQPLIVERAATPPQADTTPPPQPAAAKTRIPEGTLDRAQSDRTVRNRPTTLRKREVERTRQAQQVKEPESARRAAAAGRPLLTPDTPPATPQTPRDNRPARPETRATHAVSDLSAVSARTPAQAAGNAAPAGDSPTTVGAASARKEAGVEPAAGKDGGPGDNPFVYAVSGRKRELVEKMLASDKRLQQAVTPRPAGVTIPEQARRKTVERLQKAAASGFSHAQFNLARKYLHGEDVPKDRTEAVKLLTRAAQQGYTPAQSLLGLARFTGLGVPQDQAESAFWWSLAADAGNDGAKTAAALLQNLLKPHELVQSRRLRARWGSLINDFADLSAGKTNRRDLDSALRDAAEQGDLDAVLSLLARGADADKAGDEGRSAVINAAWRGRPRIIQLLLDRGVATELTDDGGRTPLVWAAINGHDDIVELLIESGANPNQIDGNGGTALIRAAWNGHTSVVRRLIGAGANLDMRDGNGLTALAHARRENNTAIIRALSQAGAR